MWTFTEWFFIEGVVTDKVQELWEKVLSSRSEEDFKIFYNFMFEIAGRYFREPNAERKKDIIQDSLIKVWEALQGQRPLPKEGQTFNAWFGRLIQNAWKDSIRKVASQERRTKAITPQPDVRSGRLGKPEPVDLAFDPDPTDGEDLALLRTEIDKLPEALRLAVELLFQGKKYEEIASILRIPVGTVKSRLGRVRQIMRQRLAS